MPLGRYTVLTLIGSAIWCVRARRHRLGARPQLGALPPATSATSTTRSRSRDRRSLSLAYLVSARRRRSRYALSLAVPKIPLVDVKAQYAPLIPELKERVRATCSRRARSSSARTSRRSSRRRPPTSACRRRSASRTAPTRSCSCSTRMGIGPGDEVICPAFTFYATAEAIARRGATPVFADIDPATLNLDPEDVAARITPRTKAIMPVHLFGRPAPLEQLARARPAADRGRGAGVRLAAGSRTERRLDLQLLPDEEPLRARRRRPRRGQRRASSASGSACSASTARATRRTSSYVGYNSRLDEIQAAALRIFLPHLDELDTPRAARPPRATRELGLGELVEPPDDEPGHVYHLFVVPLAASATGSRRRSTRGRDRLRDVLPAAAASAAGARATSATARAPSPRPRSSAARTSRCRSGPASRPSSSRRVVEVVLAQAVDASPRERAFPVNRHRLWQLLADARAGRRRLVARVPAPLRPGRPALLRDALRGGRSAIVVAIKLVVFVLFGFYNRWWRYVSTRDMWRAARGVTVASLDRRRHPSISSRRCTTSRLPRAIAALDFLLTLAFVAGTRLLARTLIERPQRGLVARGKEVLIVGAGDAAQLIIKRDAAQPAARARRRSASIDDDPRKKNLRIHGVRVLGTTDDLPHLLRDNRPDEVLIAIPSASGDSARAGRRDRARGGRAGQDAAGAARADRGRRSTSPARSARSRSRTCSAASRSRSTSRPSRRTSRARPCS